MKKIADLIPKGSVLADIGTDHAYLPVYCILNGIATRAIAMDINSGPLNTAEENIVKYKLKNKTELRLSNGIEQLKKGEADVIVIAGMGGFLIKDIIDRGKNLLNENTLLIMQPMIAVSELREYLYNSAFNIENEYLAAEGDKLYNIIVARFNGKNIIFDKKDIFIGKNIKENTPELYECYIKRKIEKITKKINGLKMANNQDKQLINAAETELGIYKKELEKI